VAVLYADFGLRFYGRYTNEIYMNSRCSRKIEGKYMYSYSILCAYDFKSNLRVCFPLWTFCFS